MYTNLPTKEEILMIMVVAEGCGIRREEGLHCMKNVIYMFNDQKENSYLYLFAIHSVVDIVDSVLTT